MIGRRRSAAEAAKANLAWIVLGAAIVAAFVVIGLWGRGQVLRGDEWAYAQRLASGSFLDAIVHPPPGKYLTVAPLAYYDVMFENVGIANYLPYRLAGIGLLGLNSLLWFVYARRRVGDLLALGPAILLLFLGSGWEVVAAPLRLPSEVAIAAGLGALIALERPSRPRDVAACLLLTLAITSHPVGLAFVAAGAVLVVTRHPRSWRGAWVALVPLVAYGIWHLAAYTSPPDQPSASLGDVVTFAVKSLAAFCAAATGAFRLPWTAGTDFLALPGSALAVLFAGVVLWRVLRAGTVPASTWAVLAALAVLLVAPAFAPGSGREPTASRYLYPGVLVLLLAAVELAAGARARDGARTGLIAVAAAVFAGAMLANVLTLHDRARELATGSQRFRAELALLDVARPSIPESGFNVGVGTLTQPRAAAPAGSPASAEALSDRLVRAAAPYYAVRDEFGSPAMTAAELRGSPQAASIQADAVLARMLGVAVRPGPGSASRHRCSRRADVLALPPGSRATFIARRRVPVLHMERFTSVEGVPLSAPPGRIATLKIPLDAAPELPWRLSVVSTEEVTVCRSA